MKLHTWILTLTMQGVFLSSACGETMDLLTKLAAYEQGKPLADLIETRQAVFLNTNEDTVRAERERALLNFIASDATPQAKAIAIEWLGCLGSAASVPGLVAARENPALAAPVAAALERLPGPEALQARLPKTEKSFAVSPSAAEAATFSTALTRQPASPDADKLVATALLSPNDLLAGAALRRIRAGAGSPALSGSLLAGIDKLPATRQILLCEALATRVQTSGELHDYLTQKIRTGDPACLPTAVTTLGRILRPDDLPMVLAMTADPATPGLTKPAQAALVRGTDSAINPALIRIAVAEIPLSIAAIDALAARHVTEAINDLHALARSNNPGISAAAYKSLGAIMKPEQLGELLKQLTAANDTPLAKLVWDLARRHPDPTSAATLLEQAASTAPAGLKQLLLQYATRIRPKKIAPQATPSLDLPKEDDRGKLMPDGHEEVAYLDCGTFSEVRGGNLLVRRTTGDGYQFGGVAHPLATVDFGKTITYELTGLDSGADYVLGLSAWDADQTQRRQSLRVNGKDILTNFVPAAWHADKATYTRIHLPLPREATASGRTTLTMNCVSGPNAVVSELWLLRRKQPAAKRVLILTGDDYPAHLWRETAPGFAAILRSDPRLEVTISESPALLGSSALSSYDTVFLHFKNYATRLPTSEPLWKNLEAYVNDGGGLVIAHFGCGALQEWNGFVKTAGRIWDPGKRGHDPYGEFLVRILKTGHPATRGLQDFTTTDELYTCLAGDTKVDMLAEATSKIDDSIHPMAMSLQPGKGRVFNSPLGHNLAALKARGVRDLYLNATLWTTGLIE